MTKIIVDFRSNLFFNKLIACVVFFCLVITSSDIISANTNISVLQSAKVSADTLMSQFFYISSFPVDAISKMFVERTQEDILSSAKTQNSSNKKAKEGSSAKASLGYSILPNSVNFLHFTKVKVLRISRYLKHIENFISFDFSVLRCSNLRSLNGVAWFNIIMILMLAILLGRRKISDDNIVTNIIINNKTARLV